MSHVKKMAGFLLSLSSTHNYAARQIKRASCIAKRITVLSEERSFFHRNERNDRLKKVGTRPDKLVANFFNAP